MSMRWVWRAFLNFKNHDKPRIYQSVNILLFRREACHASGVGQKDEFPRHSSKPCQESVISPPASAVHSLRCHQDIDSVPQRSESRPSASAVRSFECLPGIHPDHVRNQSLLPSNSIIFTMVTAATPHTSIFPIKIDGVQWA